MIFSHKKIKNTHVGLTYIFLNDRRTDRNEVIFTAGKSSKYMNKNNKTIFRFPSIEEKSDISIKDMTVV